jgi:hypothetical protein
MKRRETRSRRLIEALAVAGVMGITGCPQPMQDTPDAFRVPDAAMPGDDAPTVDGGVDAFAPSDSPARDAGPPDAGPERCTAEGMFRRVSCACAGMQTERCMGGFWSVTVACSGVTVCTPGTFETMPGDFCGTIQRECPDGCAWTEWVVVDPGRECQPTLGDICNGLTMSNCRCRADCTCEAVPGCPYPVGYRP